MRTPFVAELTNLTW